MVTGELSRRRASLARAANLWPFDFYDTPVSVRLDDATLGEAMDALVKTAPGVGWAIEERVDQSSGHGSQARGEEGAPTYCMVKLFTGDSWLHTSGSVPVRLR
jgi:hypothetical protein